MGKSDCPYMYVQVDTTTHYVTTLTLQYVQGCTYCTFVCTVTCTYIHIYTVLYMYMLYKHVHVHMIYMYTSMVLSVIMNSACTVHGLQYMVFPRH